MTSFSFRRATAADASEMWAIIEPILAKGDTWVFAPPKSPLDRIQMLDYWLSNEKYTYVCMIDNQIVGIFFIKENQPDLGNHIANAGYMTHVDWRGRGVGYAMGAFSLQEARRLGIRRITTQIAVYFLNAPKLWLHSNEKSPAVSKLKRLCAKMNCVRA